MTTQIISSQEKITPAKAIKLLEKNTHNRPLRSGLITKYSAQMALNEWKLNGETIIVADNGDVMDGQHRLWACVEANKPFTTMLVTGIKRASYDTIDVGANRNGSDILVIEGFNRDLARCCAAAAATLIYFEHWANGYFHAGRENAHLATPAKVAIRVQKDNKIVEKGKSVLTFGRKDRVLTVGQLVFLWYLMDAKSAEDTADYFQGVMTGANLSVNDPRLVVRNKLLTMKYARSRWTSRARMGAFIRGWKWFIEGRVADTPGNLFRVEAMESSFKLLL